LSLANQRKLQDLEDEENDEQETVKIKYAVEFDIFGWAFIYIEIQLLVVNKLIQDFYIILFSQ
jgi:hypothetical protein